MKKKGLQYLILPVITVILELLPYGTPSMHLCRAIRGTP